MHRNTSPPILLPFRLSMRLYQYNWPLDSPNLANNFIHKMNLPYNPHTRTFKLICYQNQVAHLRNRASAKSLTDSNLSLNQSPQHYHPARSKQRSRPQLAFENERLAQRLCGASCTVPTREDSLRHYSAHKQHSLIASRYQDGLPKESLRLPSPPPSAQLFCTVWRPRRGQAKGQRIRLY